ncbi:MAG: hypothetical protein ACRDTV_15835 [Mycobacterium sp.]
MKHPQRPELHPDHNINDLGAVLEEARRRRAPKDITRRHPDNDGKPLPPLPVGPVTVTHAEVGCNVVDPDAHGVPVFVDQFTTEGWLAAPVTLDNINRFTKEDN